MPPKARKPHRKFSQPKTNSKKRAAEEYESDGGFVEDDDDDEGGKRKKVKRGKDDKKGDVRKKVPGGGDTDGKGEEFWEISNKRRVTVSLFSGKHMISIREYYEKDGESLPGKKGISLSLEQFNGLVSVLPHIETVLAEKGETIKRPDYDGDDITETAKKTKDEESNSEDEEAEATTRGGKKNFEETSDEE